MDNLEKEQARIEKLENHIKEIDNKLKTNDSSALRLARQKTVEELQHLKINKFFR